MSWINLAEGMKLKPAFWDDFGHVGKTITFKLEDDETHFRVMRVDKPRGKLWVKQIEFLTPEQIGVEMARNELNKRDKANET